MLRAILHDSRSFPRWGIDVLETSVVAGFEELAELVRSVWGIDPESSRSVDSGSANCRILIAADARYFLKEYQHGVSEAKISAEAAILDHLRADGVPVSRVVSTRHGDTVHRFRARTFQLQTYIDGTTFSPYAAPVWLSRALPEMLGRIVTSLQRMPMLPAVHQSWFRRDFAARAEEFEAFASRSSRATWLASADRERLAGAARRRAELVRVVAGWKVPEDTFTCVNSHGDYSIHQVVCAEDDIAAVVDFVNAGCFPIVWELIRSFTYLDAASRNGGMDPAGLREYLAAFEEHVRLTWGDRRHMIDLYALQLAPSTFGLRQLLEGPVPEQDRLLEFACWRTAMSETLVTRRDELFAALMP
jgi:Ser/Thr protein kinase RdoA (MazF antagonist)